MKNYLLILALIVLGINHLNAAEPSYDMELTASDLEITQTNNTLHFTATANTNAIALSMPGVALGQYGEYWATTNGTTTTYPIEGTFVEMACQGEGIYSYSEEHQSDMLVAYITVEEVNMTIKVTMYTQNTNAATEIVVVENMTKTIQGTGRYAMLLLTGEHATYGTIQVYLDQYKEGQYGTYTIYWANVGGIEMSGSGTWSKQEDAEVLEASLQNKDGSKAITLIGSTSTIGTTDVENTIVDIKTEKIIRNGQILILKNGVTYSVLGNKL